MDECTLNVMGNGLRDKNQKAGLSGNLSKPDSIRIFFKKRFLQIYFFRK